MSTQRVTDHGDHILIETGEPTVNNPTVWHRTEIQWKTGTPGANEAVVTDYLVARQARLRNIRTSAQAIAATTSFNNTTRDTALRDLAAAVDDLAQFDIRLARRVLGLYETTD